MQILQRQADRTSTDLTERIQTYCWQNLVRKQNICRIPQYKHVHVQVLKKTFGFESNFSTLLNLAQLKIENPSKVFDGF